jgi:hypothetical protein
MARPRLQRARHAISHTDRVEIAVGAAQIQFRNTRSLHRQLGAAESVPILVRERQP